MNNVLISTPCAGAVLAWFGITGTTWNERTKTNVWMNTLRRHGISLRSVKSQLRKSEQRVGGARKRLAEIAMHDSTITGFIVAVHGHVLLLNTEGKTIVDTSTRQRDKRTILKIYAIR